MVRSIIPTQRSLWEVVAILIFSLFSSAFADEYRSYDGSANNVANPDWGSANTQLMRESSGAAYGDGISSMAGGSRPNPREVSNSVFSQTTSITNSRGMTDFVWTWGQFVDHDIDLTPGVSPSESAPISVPTGDAWMDSAWMGTVEIPMNRSDYDHATGVTDARQQVNHITAYIDGSVVYGSDESRALYLREGTGGRMLMTALATGDYLPYDDGTFFMDHGPAPSSATFFVAGDVRANEQPSLLAMQTLFVREHNYWASRIASENPTFDDEAIYQAARRMVGAEIQAITYNEFLPALLGSGSLGTYQGYDDSVNAGVSNVFSTAAYRLGHTLLSPNLQLVDEYGNSAGTIALRDGFFNPNSVTGGLDPMLRGLASQVAQELDAQLVDDVRNFLFGPPGAGGMDLASLNIQRGRDHGLPDYNTVRQDFGLSALTSFYDITSDSVLADKLALLYGDINDIDLWVGLLAEDHLAGSSVGETLLAIITDQFGRLRDGDRFWYENILSPEELAEVSSTKLSDIIMRNTDITGLRSNVFVVPEASTIGLTLLAAIAFGVMHPRRNKASV